MDAREGSNPVGEQAAARATADRVLVSDQDRAHSLDRAEAVSAILRHGDLRDQAAELRDRQAETRAPEDSHVQSALDREWAGRDRDDAASDRAQLISLLEDSGPDISQSSIP